MKTRRSKRAAAMAMIAAALLAGCAENPESTLKSAKELLGKNNRAAAVIQLRNALQKNPDLAEARLLLGKSLFESGELAAAEKELRKASELNYSPDEVVPVLANLLAVRGDYKKAVEEFGTTTLIAPQAKAALLATLGQAHLALGNSELAKDKFETALVLVPDFPPALMGQAQMSAAAGDLPGALAQVERAVTKAPTLSEGWRFKGDLLSSQAKADEALVAYRKAIETDPYNLAAQYIVVSLLIQQGKTEEAGKQLEAMQKIAAKYPQTMYLQALLAFRQQNYTEAREAIQQHLKVAPDNPVGLLLSAQINYQLKAYTQADAELRKVLQLIPSQRAARRLLVRTYLRTRQPVKALDTMTPMLQEEDLDGDSLTLIGEVYAQNGDMAKAAKFFEKSATHDPKSASKRTTLALAHLATGKDGQGFQELEEAAAADTGIRADVALIGGNVRQRKFDAALAAVAALEKKQPDSPLVHNLRGEVFLAKGEVAGARKSFEQAVAKDPAYFPAAANLARLDLADKKPEDARKRFDTVLAKAPKSVPAMLALADMRAKDGASMDEVANLITQAVAADPADPSSRRALVTHYIQRNEPKLAVTAAQEALNAQPDQPEILDAAGRAYLAAGNNNQALTTYGKLANAQPDSLSALMRMAQAQLATGDKIAALASLRKVLVIKPDFIEAQRIVITLDLNAGRDSAALATARDIQKQRPKEPVGYVLEGDIRVQQKAWGEAAAAYRKGLKNAATTDLAIRLKGTLDKGGNSAEAEKFVASWLKEKPDDMFFRHFMSELAMAKQDYASAAKQYNAILEIKPDDAVALNNLAWSMGQLKDPKAIEYAEKAAKLSPDNPTVMDTMGVLLVEKGDTKRGIDLLQKAVGASPNAPAFRLHLARALIKDGQKEVAKKELETLAKLGDKFSARDEVVRLMQGL